MCLTLVKVPRHNQPPRVRPLVLELACVMIVYRCLIGILCTLALTGAAVSPIAHGADKSSRRTATLVVCASNTVEKSGCDLTLTGTDDQKQINNAIAECSSENGCKI